MVDPGQAITPVFDRHAEPDVAWTPARGEVRGQAFGAFRQDLERVLRRPTDDVEYAIKERVRDVIVEQVAH